MTIRFRMVDVRRFKPMKIIRDTSEQTIQSLGKQSLGVVFFITTFFAVGGGLLEVFTEGKGIWGLWIPLCFLVIPPVHYLSREVLRLRQRLSELERRLQRE